MKLNNGIQEVRGSNPLGSTILSEPLPNIIPRRAVGNEALTRTEVHFFSPRVQVLLVFQPCFSSYLSLLRLKPHDSACPGSDSMAA